jgi:hypothetical protein
MSNVVQFLEALARNPEPLSAVELAAALESARLDPMEERAILNGDVKALNHALGGSATMLCFIAPAEEEEPMKDDEPEQEEESDAPTKESSVRAA